MKPSLALALVLALLAVLAGCGAPGPPPSAVAQRTALGPQEARCQQQTDNDPAVKAVLVQAPLMSGDPAWQEQLAQARRKAVDTCLAAAGVAVRGGVQPISRAHYGLGWY